jgi:hypothetical protein
VSADLVSFEWAIRALAQEAEVQKGLVPEAVPPAEELALEFERSYSPIPASLIASGVAILKKKQGAVRCLLESLAAGIAVSAIFIL